MNKSIKTSSSNVIFSDYPDADVIRVENTYYMVSTTMHFFPGCAILRSYNLVDWELASYVYDSLDGSEGQKLEDGKGIYGQGMWAATLRHHNGKFYIAFVANDTHKTYLFTSKKIEGPWKKSEIKGFYHDMSLLFDDNRVFVAYGNTEIHLVELDEELKGPKDGGINKIIVRDKGNVELGYEGTHLYKINGKYYLFFIHWPCGKMRTEACYVSDKIDGPYSGKDVLCSDYKNWNSGVAQGGIVNTPEGKWYGMLFQDHGALGRIPILVPVTFKNDFPIFGSAGKVCETITVSDTNPSYEYKQLFSSSFLDKDGNLNKNWQWNHEPSMQNVDLKENTFAVKVCGTAKNPCLCKNSLTQRAFTEHCAGEVTLNFEGMNSGDVAGLCALEGDYAFIAVERRNNHFFIVYCQRETSVEKYKIGSVDTSEPRIVAEKEISESTIQLKLEFDLSREKQKAYFYYYDPSINDFILFGEKQLSFTLDMFTGVRFDLFGYGKIQDGGTVSFSNFKYSVL